MPKPFRYLIMVWSLVCGSGLGIFLFQLWAPSITPQTAFGGRELAEVLVFFGLLWTIPVSVIAVKGRRARKRDFR